MQTMPSENYSPIYQNDNNIESAFTDPGSVEQVPVRYGESPQTTDTPTGKRLRPLKKSFEVIRKPVPTPHVELKSSIDGAVIEFADQSVKCELYTKPSTRIVYLPRALFPTVDIRIGLPIILRVDRIDGVRKPVVVVREIDINSLGEGADVFDLVFE